MKYAANRCTRRPGFILPGGCTDRPYNNAVTPVLGRSGRFPRIRCCVRGDEWTSLPL